MSKWIKSPEVLELLATMDCIQPGDRVVFTGLEHTGGLSADYNNRIAVVVKNRERHGWREYQTIRHKVRFLRFPRGMEWMGKHTWWIWKESRLIAWRRPKQKSG
jgi:hypothetical protein